MSGYFFDTSALIPRYMRGKFTYRVNQLFASKNQIVISEISMVEIVSALASNCRDKGLTASDFDRFHGAFLEDVATGRINVKSLSSYDMNRARHLLILGGVVNRRSLKSSDALIAVSCREHALETRQRWTFYTKDWRLYSTLYEINAYRSALRLRFFGRGRGGIPASTN